MRYDGDIAWIKSTLCRVDDDQGRAGLGFECHLPAKHGGEFHESILGHRWPLKSGTMKP